VGILMMFYGLYFGVTGRDLAEAATDRMANNLGYVSRDGIPSKQANSNICVLCDEALSHVVRPGEAAPMQEKVRTSGGVGLRACLSFIRSLVSVAAAAWPLVLVCCSRATWLSVVFPLSSLQLEKLTCGHQFHEACIRGWTMVGKKNICPQCSEKVELGKLFATNPWEKGSVAWAQILDIVRYFVVWQPILLIFSQLALWIMGYADH